MTAVLSSCRSYRYWLERTVAPTGLVFAYFGVNPSIADAIVNDQTVAKWIGFTRVNGGSRFIVGNVFAFRSTNVKLLRHARDPIGPMNRFYIDAIIKEADVLVPCWGNSAKVPAELRLHMATLLAQLHASGKPVMSFGLTKSGDPMHPQMLGYNTQLIELKRAA